jgi:leader peptidase (prepilin peptidase)/N-methyltransferase
MRFFLSCGISLASVCALAFYTDLHWDRFWVVYGAIFGACIGSFLNVVIYRLPVMLERQWTRDCKEHLGLPDDPPEPKFNLAVPRSRCPKCGRQIRALENIPILSYAFLRGRCAGCATPISIRYPLVEMLCGVLTAAAFAVFGASYLAIAVSAFLLVSVAIALIDADTMIIPDDLSLPLLWGGLLLSAAGIGISLQDAVLGAAVGYGSLWAVNAAYKLLRKFDGMGQGDFKYLSAAGAFLGMKPLVIVVCVASLAAVLNALVGAALRSKAVERTTQMPFGPWLALGAGATLLAKPYWPAFVL